MGLFFNHANMYLPDINRIIMLNTLRIPTFQVRMFTSSKVAENLLNANFHAGSVPATITY